MLNRHAVAKCLPAQRCEHGCQSNLRHQHQNPSTSSTHRRRRAQIDLGLTAARDAVQQHRLKQTVARHTHQPVNGGGLLLGELSIGGSGTHRDGIACKRVPLHCLCGHADEASAREPGHEIPPDPLGHQRRHRHAIRIGGEPRDDGSLSR